jgi:hypothetical protein
MVLNRIGLKLCENDILHVSSEVKEKIQECVSNLKMSVQLQHENVSRGFPERKRISSRKVLLKGVRGETQNLWTGCEFPKRRFRNTSKHLFLALHAANQLSSPLIVLLGGQDDSNHERQTAH